MSVLVSGRRAVRCIGRGQVERAGAPLRKSTIGTFWALTEPPLRCYERAPDLAKLVEWSTR